MMMSPTWHQFRRVLPQYVSCACSFTDRNATSRCSKRFICKRSSVLEQDVHLARVSNGNNEIPVTEGYRRLQAFWDSRKADGSLSRRRSMR